MFPTSWKPPQSQQTRTSVGHHNTETCTTHRCLHTGRHTHLGRYPESHPERRDEAPRHAPAHPRDQAHTNTRPDTDTQGLTRSMHTHTHTHTPLLNKNNTKTQTAEYALEGLMLKLKRQYFGHVMRRANSLEKTMRLGKIVGKSKRG